MKPTNIFLTKEAFEQYARRLRLEKAIEHKRKSDPTWDERAKPVERAEMLRDAN